MDFFTFYKCVDLNNLPNIDHLNFRTEETKLLRKHKYSVPRDGSNSVHSKKGDITIYRLNSSDDRVIAYKKVTEFEMGVPGRFKDVRIGIYDNLQLFLSLQLT